MSIGPLVQCVGLLLGGVCVDNDEWVRCRRDCVVSCPGIEWRAAAQTPETRLSSVLTPPSLSLSLWLVHREYFRPHRHSTPAAAAADDDDAQADSEKMSD